MTLPRARLGAALALVFAVACSDTGTPEGAGLPPSPISPLRVLTATVTGVDDVADPFLQAVPTSGPPVGAAADGPVELPLEVGRTYLLEISDGPEPSTVTGLAVASVVFEERVGGPLTSVLPIATPGGPLALGIVARDGALAIPERNPLADLDSDDDGLSDLEDEDDDGDQNADGLRVVRIEPQDGETDVDVDEEIEIRFSLSLDASTVSAATVRVEGPSGTVDAELELSGGDDEVELVPVDPLAGSTRYRVIVESGVRSIDGRALEAPASSTFETGDGDDDD